MENNSINQPYKVKIKASVLLNKFKHKDDRYNFCREKSILFFIIIRFLFPKRGIL